MLNIPKLIYITMNSLNKQSLATLVATEQFTKASKKFWNGTPGNSPNNPVEIGAYDQFQPILNPTDWVILQNWLLEGDNPEWKVATVNSFSELSMTTIND